MGALLNNGAHHWFWDSDYYITSLYFPDYFNTTVDFDTFSTLPTSTATTTENKTTSNLTQTTIVEPLQDTNEFNLTCEYYKQVSHQSMKHGKTRILDPPWSQFSTLWHHMHMLKILLLLNVMLGWLKITFFQKHLQFPVAKCHLYLIRRYQNVPLSLSV